MNTFSNLRQFADAVLVILLMNEPTDRHRIPWTTRINIKSVSRDMVRQMAREECISVATFIGLAIEDFVTARSTA